MTGLTLLLVIAAALLAWYAYEVRKVRQMHKALDGKFKKPTLAYDMNLALYLMWRRVRNYLLPPRN